MMIVIYLYIVIGAFIAIYELKEYAIEDNAMYAIAGAFIACFWPLYLTFKYFKKIFNR